MTRNTKRVFFKEIQRYKKPWIRYIITAVVVIMILNATFLVRQLMASGQEGAADENERIVLITVTIFIIIFTLGFVINFTRMKMITIVTEEGIQVFYPPILRKGRTIHRRSIERFEIRQYKPLVEFGGWGIKTRGRPLRQRRYGKALTAYGKTGLQLHLRNGKKFLIGTQRPDPFRHAVSKMLESQGPAPGEKGKP